MTQRCNLLPWNSAWCSVLALFYFKTKSPKYIMILPVEGRDVVSELTECTNAGELSQEGRGFSPSDGIQEFHHWTQLYPMQKSVQVVGGKRIIPRPFNLISEISSIIYYQSISLFNCFCLFVFHIFVFDYWLLCRKEFGFHCLLRRTRVQIDRSVLFVRKTNMRHSNHFQWKLIWQNLDTESCQKIFPSLPRSTKCQFLSIYVESTKEME